MLNVLHVIYAQSPLGHLSVSVGDSSRSSEEIVQISTCAIQCDDDDDYDDDDDDDVIIVVVVVIIIILSSLTSSQMVRLHQSNQPTSCVGH